MQVSSTIKLIALLAVVLAIVVLMALHTIAAEAGLPIITTYAGYVVGNGNSARNGQVAQPVIAPKDAPA